MSIIHELDEITIGQIAAGEVIERPASVVKELVENALDAGANRILVDVVRGGVELIEISDDGQGIRCEELALAVRRHATSKLSLAQDLEAIATLGFRGEGLASIAAVARVRVISRRGDGEIGAQIEVFAEEASEVHPVAAPVGTRVRVEDLFANVPVRREYLRSASAEFSRISAWLSMLALRYPTVSLSLRHDGEMVWTMPSTQDERERLAAVFGRDATAHLLALEGAAASSIEGTLRGYISEPGFDRADRRMQLLFVNGRLVRNSPLTGAWTAAYRTFAMIGRQPYGVLFVDIPPEHVDPNVHPQKSEVRFRYAAQIADAARRAMASTLRANAAARLARQLGDVGSGPNFSFMPANAHENANTLVSLFADPVTGELAEPQRMRVLAQIHRTYILASDGDALLLVDQHAAHERIAYENIVRAAGTRTPSEPLLVPSIIELDAVQSDALDGAMDALREGGLEIEAFGERSYRITATPAGYGARAFDVRGFIDDLVDEPKQRDVRERVWASLACHSVSVAGERLEHEEMQMLLSRLRECENPMHCPHGRPTMLRLSPEELARLFKRA